LRALASGAWREMKPIRSTAVPDPRQLVEVAYGAQVELDEGALLQGSRAPPIPGRTGAREEPIYGVSTGFGSNADKLLGAHPLRDELPGATPSGRSLHEELQRNLIVTHAVCVGEPFAPEVVRAMLCIRINTLLRGHSGIRVQTLQALAAMLNAGVVPVVPQLGSVGASGDLAPLSHLAIVLLGGGEAFYDGERVPARSAARAGLTPVDAVVQGRPGAEQRHRADAGHRRAGAARWKNCSTPPIWPRR
jgi:histidine ammonia-lyase